MVKQGARRGDPPLPSATVIVRGDLLDPEMLAESAERNFAVYGVYGISVFAETTGVAWVELAEARFKGWRGSCCSPPATLSTPGWSCGTPGWHRTTT